MVLSSNHPYNRNSNMAAAHTLQQCRASPAAGRRAKRSPGQAFLRATASRVAKLVFPRARCRAGQPVQSSRLSLRTEWIAMASLGVARITPSIRTCSSRLLSVLQVEVFQSLRLRYVFVLPTERNDVLIPSRLHAYSGLNLLLPFITLKTCLEGLLLVP